MRLELLDDSAFPWPISVTRHTHGRAPNVDTWFSTWARAARARSGRANELGLFFIHANGLFSIGGRRQALEGVELLKHIRLTPWLHRAQTWHAVVYSFEPLENILRRSPSNVILLSDGVTFLQLPDALDLKNALSKAVPSKAKGWCNLSTEDLLRDLALACPAAPASTEFRPFIAADYRPRDSAHDISNLWGIYELYRAAAEIKDVVPASGNFPEVDQLGLLPDRVEEFVGSLAGKQARYLDGEHPAPSLAADSDRARLQEWLNALPFASAGKKIAYADDEASNGWSDLLWSLLIDTKPAADPSGQLVMPEPTLLTEYAKAFDMNSEAHREAADRLYCDRLTKWVTTECPDLLILDLRLLGSREKDRPMQLVSGLRTAHAVRRAAPYLPILLFTASNKAETLAISRAFTIDDVWMKPGLGEHQPVGGGLAALTQLGRKVQRLLSDEYSWLRRAGEELEAIRTKPARHHWWEKSFDWPTPERVGGHVGAGPRDPYAPPHGLRAQVVALAESALYLSRAALRVKADWPESAGPHDLESVALPLRSAAFNRIGQVVELIHGCEPVRGAPYSVSALNARSGGFRIATEFVYRRCDWLAFRLGAFRNLASHAIDKVGDLRRLDEASLRMTACDLIAWLGTSRVKLRPIDLKQATAMTASQAGLSPRERVPALRMHPGDAVGPNPVDRSCDCTNERAVLDGFRRQLADRDAFRLVLEQADRLAGG